MTAALYRPGRSVLHRLPPGLKLGALGVAGTLAVAAENIVWLAGGLVAALGVFVMSGLSVRDVLREVRPALWLAGLLFALQVVSGDWVLGVGVALRIATLVLLAALVTMTTRVAAMMATVEAVLRPFAPLGVDPARVALAVSLAIRFIPLLADHVAAIREAQQARGLGGNPAALLVPLVVRALRTADDVADAIDARSGGRDEMAAE